MTLISGYIVLIFLLLLAFWLKKHFPERSTKHRTIEIVLGQEDNAQAKSIELFKLLAKQKTPFILELIVHSIGEEIKFFISSTNKNTKKLENTISQSFPNAEIIYSPYQEILSDLNHEIKALSIGQVKDAVLPIKTAKSSDFSPFWALLRVFSTIKPLNESIALQLNVQPAGKSKSQETSEAISALSADNHSHAKRILGDDVLITKDTVKILEEKLQSPLFEVNGKIIFSSNNKENASHLENRLEQVFQQSASGGPAYNKLKARRIVATQNAIKDFYKKESLGDKPMLLNSNELAELFYFTSAKIENNPKLSSKKD